MGATPTATTTKRWNRRSLLSACEALLRRDDCVIALAKLSPDGVTAKCSYDYEDATGAVTNIRLVVDPAKSSLVEGFLHEALHVVLNHLDLAFNATLEEVLIKAIEKELWLKMPKGESERWRRLINAKLS